MLTHATSNQKSGIEKASPSSCSPYHYLFYQFLYMQGWRSHSSTSCSMLLGTQIPRSCIGHCKYGEQSAWTFCIFEDYEVLLSLLFFRLMSLIQQFIQSFPGIWDLLLLWSYSVLPFNFMTVCANPGFMLESRSQIHFIAEALPLSYKAEGYFQVPFLLV